MFTGIVEKKGKVIFVEDNPEGRKFKIEVPDDGTPLRNGDSLAVNGVCQTIETVDGNIVQLYAVPETLKVTNIGTLKENDIVNLEHPMTMNDMLGGHIVQGHIEAMAEVIEIIENENYWDITFRFKSPYLIPKGSISIDGISLTIHEIKEDTFRVEIIPETLKKTNIPFWKVGTKVNIETDYLVKAVDHIQRFREKNS